MANVYNIIIFFELSPFKIFNEKGNGFHEPLGPACGAFVGRNVAVGRLEPQADDGRVQFYGLIALAERVL